MAKLLSPVSTTDSLLIFQTSSSSSSFSSNNQWRILAKTTITITTGCGSGKRGGRIKAVAEESSSFDGVADDYYAVLGLLPDATPDQIMKAYYNCMKSCHPDFNGNDPEINNFCMFINEIYEVLSDPVQRMVYDDIHGYSLTATNPFLDDSSTKDHAFVDEFSCIAFMISEEFHTLLCQHPWTGQSKLYVVIFTSNAVFEILDNVDNFKVKGGGTINGNGDIWWKNSCKRNKSLVLSTIAAHIASAARPEVSHVPSSIWDAEETCDAFSFRTTTYSSSSMSSATTTTACGALLRFCFLSGIAID
ncbi:hypothetical protein ACHQM5_018372 [Ranunculus cassubicifolius]